MPELPEVETVCRGLSARILGDTIDYIDLRRRGLRFPFPPALKKLHGQKIRAIERRAKYALLHLDDDRTIILHLGMSGRLLICERDEKTPPSKHDHVIFHFKSGRRVLFNDARRFGVLDIAGTAELPAHKFFAHLGPEPLDHKAFTAKVLLEKLQGRKTPLKVAIMDQAVVVGVGNIYASESLFMAGIDPRMPAAALDAAQAKLLVRAIRDVLNRAIKAGGSSLRDYVQTDGELGYFQHDFAVYDRAGEKCRGCTCSLKKTGGIKKVTQGGRSTFFCETRQKQRIPAK